ncbi:GMC family oxidoreductase N-terminal domain-containing protein [Caenibius sp. WL]|uniref:GMC family oxidoreductase n=1 Tax=Caenibius sp. WL TaxID=2872646 RepID=UPI001C99D654|nr:GMC family oxidoreductase N-terminal domain-containing protein [Caenibius sp. WL]QZP09209.1 GMC family oxidoreductase N-terminal domain-containing protein [Caenibius sp. WL]
MPQENRHFDIVIVGAGSAGCVLANRLSDGTGLRVLLVEAGPKDRSPLIHIPGFFTAMYRPGKFSWVYPTAPQPHVDGRVLRDVRGKVLGGSSSTNGMLYCRGAAADYDGWAAMGNAGWSYREVLPYFKRAEDHDGGGDAYHGVGGPLHVKRSRVEHPLARAFIAAAVEAGHPYNEDINGARREGFGPAEATIWHGRRWSTASAYLKPALKRPNLTVMTGAQVTRILIDKGRAVGIELARGSHVVTCMAGEVVLSAGAFQSPHLLMLSGIGDGRKLAAHGIRAGVDLPGVGANLHDHASITAHARCSAPISYSSLLNPLHAGQELFKGLIGRRGFMADCSIEAVGMVRSLPEQPVPDIKYQFVPIRLDPLTSQPLPEHGMVNRMELTVPESRGEVRLASADPLALPVLDANYLAEPGDLARLREALRMAIEIYRQPAFREFGVEPDLPVADMADDAALDTYIRATLTNDHHAAGTCKMGHDPAAVVDARLRVHGVDNLRVVDASVMPVVVSGNTNAPTIMIAEKASDMILGREPLPAAPV